MLLALGNFVLVVVRGCHLRSVDSEMESRIKRDVSIALISRFDEWACDQTNFSSVARIESSALAGDSDREPEVRTRFVNWVYGSDHKGGFLSVDGAILHVGDDTEFGRLTSISRRIVRTDGGYQLVLGRGVSHE